MYLMGGVKAQCGRRPLGTPLRVQFRVMYIIYKYIVYSLLLVPILRTVPCVPHLLYVLHIIYGYKVQELCIIPTY
jgi:hypothetical protein